ncbi:MAG TPA: CHAP domain-containing protein [Stellaceae bacterium]|nr:CHAP domain-containing protein [Stellaceae bacterium]
MRLGVTSLVCCLLAALLSLPAAAGTQRHRKAEGLHAGNCVAYVREVTGIHVSGNAGSWWHHAEGRYRRGHEPAVGAVLVFKPHGRMRLGHVAVVSRVVNRHEILVDHANWVRGRISKAMPVIDTSPENDWSSVKVARESAGSGARENPTYGFIYPSRGGTDEDMTVATELGVTHMARIVQAALDHPLPHTHRHGHHHPRHAGGHQRHHHHDDAETLAQLGGPI